MSETLQFQSHIVVFFKYNFFKFDNMHFQIFDYNKGKEMLSKRDIHFKRKYVNREDAFLVGAIVI